MSDPSDTQVRAVIQVIAEHNVAMRACLDELKLAEKPIRDEFEAAIKPHHDRYQIACKELATIKDARLAEIAQEGKQDA